MNKFVFLGRACEDAQAHYTQGEKATCISNFNFAVDKKFKKKDDPEAPTADFFRITAIGKLGEFAEKYIKKGTKLVISGRIENNNYTNKDGAKVYGFQFVAEEIDFAESKKAAEENANAQKNTDFVSVPDGLEADLPFK